MRHTISQDLRTATFLRACWMQRKMYCECIYVYPPSDLHLSSRTLYESSRRYLENKRLTINDRLCCMCKCFAMTIEWGGEKGERKKYFLLVNLDVCSCIANCIATPKKSQELFRRLLYSSWIIHGDTWIIHGGSRKMTACFSTFYGVKSNFRCRHSKNYCSNFLFYKLLSDITNLASLFNLSA